MKYIAMWLYSNIAIQLAIIPSLAIYTIATYVFHLTIFTLTLVTYIALLQKN